MENTTKVCQFSEPVFWDIGAQELKPLTDGFIAGRNWNFQKSNCQSSTTIDYIEYVSTSTGESFYLDKTISYGDIFLWVFILIFAFAGVLGFIFKLIFKENVSLKR